MLLVIMAVLGFRSLNSSRSKPTTDDHKTQNTTLCEKLKIPQNQSNEYQINYIVHLMNEKCSIVVV